MCHLGKALACQTSGRCIMGNACDRQPSCFAFLVTACRPACIIRLGQTASDTDRCDWTTNTTHVRESRTTRAASSVHSLDHQLFFSGTTTSSAPSPPRWHYLVCFVTITARYRPSTGLAAFWSRINYRRTAMGNGVFGALASRFYMSLVLAGILLLDFARKHWDRDVGQREQSASLLPGFGLGSSTTVFFYAWRQPRAIGYVRAGLRTVDREEG